MAKNKGAILVPRELVELAAKVAEGCNHIYLATELDALLAGSSAIKKRCCSFCAAPLEEGHSCEVCHDGTLPVKFQNKK